MVENDLKATFFVVGSRAISRPQMLQYEYMAGNQISVHTWAHPPLTTRTNDEIVAELGWSKEAIRQIVRPQSMWYIGNKSASSDLPPSLSSRLVSHRTP